ncbi:MAG TPA: contractile injection system protein, VgrG/Pvc8 family [Polyangiaceae bacterium]|nr:contractile injection system protein, VgrG/Pvc8 family [Polyangiaceae bacterium]
MTEPFDRSAPGVRLSLVAAPNAASVAPLDLGGRLVGFTYEDSDEKADKLTLELDNFDLALFDREELFGGALLEASWGYPGVMAPPRRAVVKSVKGFTTLTVEAQALSALMNKRAKTRRFEGATRADVVRQVAAEYGYAGGLLDVEDTGERYDVVNQAGETDARFLKRLAEREHFQFYVDAGGLHFHRRRQEAPPARVFTWYVGPGSGEVLSVRVESDLARRVGAARVRGRDPLRKETLDASSNAASAPRATLGDVVEVVDPETGATALQQRNATANVAPTSASSAGRAQREADARFVKAERDAVKLSLQVVGDPTLAAKTVVEVRGISALLSGKYYVREVKHTLGGGGYVCDLTLTRDGKGTPAGAEGRGRPQGGAKNAYPTPAPGDGSMQAFETIDPETGASVTQYHAAGKPPGAGDPEGERR